MSRVTEFHNGKHKADFGLGGINRMIEGLMMAGMDKTAEKLHFFVLKIHDGIDEMDGAFGGMIGDQSRAATQGIGETLKAILESGEK